MARGKPRPPPFYLTISSEAVDCLLILSPKQDKKKKKGKKHSEATKEAKKAIEKGDAAKSTAKANGSNVKKRDLKPRVEEVED